MISRDGFKLRDKCMYIYTPVCIMMYIYIYDSTLRINREKNRIMYNLLAG